MPPDSVIQDLERKAWEINQSQDSTLMDELIDPNWTSIAPAGLRVSRDQAKRLLKSITISSYDLSDIEVRWPSEDVAIISYKATYKAEFAGQSIVSFVSGSDQGAGESIITSVWRSTNRKWLQISYQETPIRGDIVSKITSLASKLLV